MLRIDFFGEWVERVISTGEKAIRPVNVQQGQRSASPVPSEGGPEERIRPQPRCFWLPAFFFPQGTSILHTTYVVRRVM